MLNYPIRAYLRFSPEVGVLFLNAAPSDLYCSHLKVFSFVMLLIGSLGAAFSRNI